MDMSYQLPLSRFPSFCKSWSFSFQEGGGTVCPFTCLRGSGAAENRVLSPAKHILYKENIKTGPSFLTEKRLPPPRRGPCGPHPTPLPWGHHFVRCGSSTFVLLSSEMSCSFPFKTRLRKEGNIISNMAEQGAYSLVSLLPSEGVCYLR